MIRKFIYGTPFNTEAVTTEIRALTESRHTERSAHPDHLTAEKVFHLHILWIKMISSTVWAKPTAASTSGAGFTSDCTDDPNHTEDKHSLYGAHNFVIISGKETFGLFFDYPGKLTFDIGYTRQDAMRLL